MQRLLIKYFLLSELEHRTKNRKPEKGEKRQSFWLRGWKSWKFVECMNANSSKLSTL